MLADLSLCLKTKTYLESAIQVLAPFHKTLKYTTARVNETSSRLLECYATIDDIFQPRMFFFAETPTARF